MSGYISKRYAKNVEKWSQPIYKVKVTKNVKVEMRDGVHILVDVYQPDVDEAQKFPALLAMSPFGKDVQEMQRWLPPQKWYESPMWDGNMEVGDIDYLVSRGYALVVADPRGIGHSEGEYLGLLGSMGQDGYDTVEWIAAQSWCNGDVGMTGICIFSAAQELVAALRPPHLKVIAPFEVWGDVYRGLAYHGGILFAMQHSVYKGKHENDDGWTLGKVTSIMRSTRSKEEIDALVEEAVKNPDIKYNTKFYAMLKYPENDPIFFDFLLNPFDGPFWWDMSPHTKFDKIDVPVYAASPWCIEIFLLNIFDMYEKIKSPIRLFLWPPGHVERPHHEFHDELVRWFDYHLKGIDTGIMDEPPIKMFVVGANRWRYENEWPLARTEWTKMYLHPYGRLVPQTLASDFEPDGFTQAPPSVTAKVNAVEYSTSPFPQDTEITGPVALYLHAEIDSTDTNFMVDLFDVTPSGEQMPLSRGYLKASHRALDEARSKPYKPYHPHTSSEPVDPGKIYEYAIELMPVSVVMKAGHSLKLVIRNQDDLMDRLGLWGLYHLPQSNTVTHKIFRDKDHQSHLLLPFIPVTDGSSWVDAE